MGASFCALSPQQLQGSQKDFLGVAGSRQNGGLTLALGSLPLLTHSAPEVPKQWEDGW